MGGINFAQVRAGLSRVTKNSINFIQCCTYGKIFFATACIKNKFASIWSQVKLLELWMDWNISWNKNVEPTMNITSLISSATLSRKDLNSSLSSSRPSYEPKIRQFEKRKTFTSDNPNIQFAQKDKRSTVDYTNVVRFHLNLPTQRQQQSVYVRLKFVGHSIVVLLVQNFRQRKPKTKGN